VNAQLDTIAETPSPAQFMGVFEEFHAPSWDGWRGILSRLTPETRELYCIAGNRTAGRR